MINETKRDVLVNAVDALADAQASGGNVGHKDANLFMAEYEKALPDDLPVIPKYVANYIEEVKQGETDLEGEINIYGAIYGALEWDQASCKESDWIQTHSDEFARAWLDGYEINKITATNTGDIEL